MALTKEQINNLKPGDPVIIHGTFIKVYEDLDLSVQFKVTHAFTDEIVTDTVYVHPSCVSLPTEQPKHDHCRPFKKGDIVEPRMLFGRYYMDEVKPLTGERCIVKFDEEKNRHIIIIHKDKDYIIDHAHLKLVTPVEELEPYSVVDAHTHWDVCRNDEQLGTLVSYSKLLHPNAKAAAEDERDRLNAEYRKEQNNDRS